MDASLYIHLPFCAGCCDYCDFYSIQINPADARIDRYIDRVLADAAASLHGVSSVPSVYLGGGTPSMIGAARLTRLLSGLASLLPAPPAEFTVEANPESADQAFFEACRANGVTRVSLGVQSFHEPSRRAVNRHAGADESLVRAAAFFPAAFSADLIAGLPLQDEAVLRADIERLAAFEPAHISLYALTLDHHTPLGKKAEQSGSLADIEDAIDDLWLFGRDILEKNGYAQYEVSNFYRAADGGGKDAPTAAPVALPSTVKNISAHNMRYWRMENWLGIGAGASGTRIDDQTGTGIRRTIRADVDAYLDAPVFEDEYLDAPTLVKETFLMGFRTMFGPDEALFQKRFRRSPADCIPRTIAAWRAQGLLAPNRTAFTSRGLLFLNRFIQEAFYEIDAEGGMINTR
jgi:oxygen-independent coproporphyrinogen-3 oxidase